MAFLVVENEKLRRKLRKSQDRRDYYARMYYHLLADMDAMRYELEHARRKIHFFQSLSKCPHGPQHADMIALTPALYTPPSSISCMVHTPIIHLLQVHNFLVRKRHFNLILIPGTLVCHSGRTLAALIRGRACHQRITRSQPSSLLTYAHPTT